MASLADLLEEHTEALVRAWEERVRALVPPGVQSEPELRDHVPEVLGELIEALRRGAPPATSAVAQQHGRQRYRLGFDLRALVGEYSVLRGVLFERIELASRSVTTAELRILTDFFSVAVADGVSEHDRQKAKRERALIEEHLRHSRLIAEVSQIFGRLQEQERILRSCAQAVVETLDVAWARIWLREGDATLAESAGEEPGPAASGTPRPESAQFPILMGEQVIGGMELLARSPLTPELRDSAQQAAGVIGLGIERLHAERERRRLLADTEAARAESELQRLRLDTLFRDAPVPICILEGPQHTFTFANAAYRALVGGRALLGKPLLEALPELQGQGFHALLDQVITTGEAVLGNETPVKLLQNGVETTLALNFIYAPKRSLQGEVEGVLVTASDVTALARARGEAEAATAELEAIFRSLPDAVYVGTSSGIDRANQAALDMLGYQDAAELNQSVGTLAEELQVRRVDTGAPVSGEDQAFSQALAGKPDIQEVLIRNRRTGEDRVIRSACAPIRVGGQVVGAVAINTDITENKRAERLLRERADFEKQLIGIVSHDLRNPLSAILLGATSLLRRDELDERTITVAARMRSSAERAARMVRDLLDFTQARLGGGIPVEPRPANLHEVAREVLEEVEATHPGRELRVQSEGDGRGEWDPDRLAQVVQNLVTNALTYSPAKTPVQVVTRGEEGAVTLSVHNQGTPIPPERLSQLFEPFHRGEETVDRTSRNVGLGLYIVKQLVAAHGGSIRAHSSEAEGTTFVVRLPRRRAGRDR